MSKYKIGFWNYEKMGVIEAKKAVQDWKDAGFNLAMTFEYRADKDKPAQMIELLDECLAKGIKAIICDSRTRYRAYATVGAEKYRKGVEDVYAEFGYHPAVYALHIGDEPRAEMWENAINAFKIAKEIVKDKKLFINMFSTWITPDCKGIVGATYEEYEERLVDFVKQTGAEIISFDCYSQCSYTDKDFEQGEFLRNLHTFANVANRTGAELFVSLLSVGHWNYRVPTQDDFRWQINMAAAHGVTGIFWFYFYQRLLEENYREGPINLFGERTPTFDRMSFQNRFFMKYYADKLEDCRVDDISYFRKAYGGYPIFTGKHELKVIETLVNNCSLCVTRWKKADGKICYTVVNVDRELPTRIRLEFEGELAGQNQKYWLAPGQLLYIDENGVV